MQASTATPALNNPRTVRAWYMYDWANSVYSLVITTAIFPIYYKATAVTADGGDVVSFLGFSIQNSVLYSYALSFSFLVVAAILPLLSGAADYTGNKKTFMRFFVWLGSLACMGLYFFTSIDTLWWGILCSVLACIGYSGSLVFYDAFLPEIVTEDRFDKTSARGYAMGYYGSVLLMAICVVVIKVGESMGMGGIAVRASFVLVGLWWVGFSQIPLHILPDNPFNRKAVGNIWTKGYEEIRAVWQSLDHQPNLKKFLWAYFFYNMGVQTVMFLATLFGTDVLHLEEGSLITIVVVIQLVGAVGAGLFARLSKTWGNRLTLVLMIVIWVGVCIGAYLTTTEMQFFILAFVVGLIMGGIQSLSRSTYSKLIPETVDHASYFSFFDVTFNLSLVVGTFAYGFVNQITGDMRNSALALAVFFVIGLVLLLKVKTKNIGVVQPSSAGA